MFLFIDALFKPLGKMSPSVSEEAGGFLTSDTSGVRDIPPFVLEPSAVMVSSSDGEVEVFDSPDTEVLLADLAEYLDGVGYPAFVGWYLDQVILPCLCANAMKYNVRAFGAIQRRLDDKWSKTNGHSVERAFWQGWYASSKEAYDSNIAFLTLDKAVRMSGMSPLDEIAERIGEGLPDTQRTLLSRISAISSLYARYQDIIA